MEEKGRGEEGGKGRRRRKEGGNCIMAFLERWTPLWGTKQWSSGISKWESDPSSSAVGARIKAPMRVGGVWREEDVRRAECADGCPLNHWGTGLGGCCAYCLLPRKKIDFSSQIGEFGCKLGAFCTVQVSHLKLV